MENVETYFMPCSILKSALFSLSYACLFVCLFFVVFCCSCFFVLLVFTYFLFCFLFFFYVHSYHCLINITRNTPWFVFDSHL